MASKRVPLPSDEVTRLIMLPPTGNELKARLRALHEAGWSLSVLGDSLIPRRSKATISNWINTSDTSSDYSFFNIPLPPEKITFSDRPLAPKVPQDISKELKRLAPLARQHRARTPQNSIFRASNENLTKLATDLYLKGIPVHEIAKATGVSDRAMFRRVQKGLGNL